MILETSCLGLANERLIAKGIDGLTDFIEGSAVNAEVFGVILPLVICVLAMLISAVMLIPAYLAQASTAKWGIRFLLFCDPAVVVQTPIIMKLLANDWGENEERKGQTDSGFFDTVVSNLLDGMLFLAIDLHIISANRAVETILGVPLEGILGKTLNDILVPVEDHEGLCTSFFGTIAAAYKGQRSPAATERDGNFLLRDGSKRTGQSGGAGATDRDYEGLRFQYCIRQSAQGRGTEERKFAAHDSAAGHRREIAER
jgi:PAS domain-containing protein